MIDIQESYPPLTKEQQPSKVDFSRTLGLLEKDETAEYIHWKNFYINPNSGKLHPARSIIIARTDGTGTPIRLERGQWRVTIVDVAKNTRTILSTETNQTFRFYAGCNKRVYLVEQLTE